MATRQRRIDRANQRADRLLTSVGSDYRDTRVGAGLSVEELGAAVGLSHSQAGRIERGLVKGVSLRTLVRIGVVLGMELSVRAYPDGDPLRDAAHAALLERLRLRLHPTLSFRTEVPLPLRGDRRAWDALIGGLGNSIGVEAETQLRDLQALIRRVALKRRDGGVDHVILLVGGTRANRRAIAEARELLAADYPIDGQAILAALGTGHGPSGERGRAAVTPTHGGERGG